MVQPLIIPAILTPDKADFLQKLQALSGLAPWISVDIADGDFVPSKTLMPQDLFDVTIPFNLDMHLMVQYPERLFEDCQKLRAKRIFFHAESSVQMPVALKQLSQMGIERGVALKLETPLSTILPFADDIDVVMLMSIQPGFQGTSFEPSVLQRIAQLKSMLPDKKIQIDGGINLDNIGLVVKKGVDYLIVGSAIVKTADYKKSLEQLNRAVQDALSA